MTTVKTKREQQSRSSRVRQGVADTHMEEAILAFEGRPETRLALMYRTDGSNAALQSRMVKVSFYVPDPAEVMENIRNEGLKIVREAVPVPELRNAIVGLAYDHDGYLVEIVKAREA